MESTTAGGDFLASDTEPTRTRSSKAPRLFIKEMVMRNFKSYAGEQRVGPFHKVRAFFFFASSKMEKKKMRSYMLF